ncbi:phosphoglycerate mutase-like protein isoform X1 [Setaria viridis]|uniref:phosphoglycerate mutase-like protein isoform X1 n=2 Tax=Setaria viridis TaxID=4556 RepID=UPI001493C186|nr:phosphoglycerate mutase-like protein isoform X3 [Setaria viridis]XP_034603761.1 phosphoglycerate mutase-like protein isoform X3 [Setaria viridis]
MRPLTRSGERERAMSCRSGMKPSAGTAMYPLHRCKTVHLVRHAQGVHNVEGEKDRSAYRSPALLDAPITPLGWRQVDSLREHVKNCGLAKKIELVICSPLLRNFITFVLSMLTFMWDFWYLFRSTYWLNAGSQIKLTMQTAVGVFGGESYTGGVGSPPLMVENAGQSERLAISSLNCPPFLAIETCRERLQGDHPCDKRRSITEYRTLFPAIDFSLIMNDEDVLWLPDVREAHKSVAARGMKFMDWLWTREEKEIAIVTHSVLLQDTLRMYSKECHPTIRYEMSKRFANCELRSMVLVDTSMLGSAGSPSLNYPGEIPTGLDQPSDVIENEEAS